MQNFNVLQFKIMQFYFNIEKKIQQLKTHQQIPNRNQNKKNMTLALEGKSSSANIYIYSNR